MSIYLQRGEAERHIKESQREYLTNYTSIFMLILISYNNNGFIKPPKYYCHFKLP